AAGRGVDDQPMSEPARKHLTRHLLDLVGTWQRQHEHTRLVERSVHVHNRHSVGDALRGGRSRVDSEHGVAGMREGARDSRAHVAEADHGHGVLHLVLLTRQLVIRRQLAIRRTMSATSTEPTYVEARTRTATTSSFQPDFLTTSISRPVIARPA